MNEFARVIRTMPRSERVGLIVIPSAFLAIFWAVWCITPA